MTEVTSGWAPADDEPIGLVPAEATTVTSLLDQWAEDFEKTNRGAWQGGPAATAFLADLARTALPAAIAALRGVLAETDHVARRLHDDQGNGVACAWCDGFRAACADARRVIAQHLGAQQ